MQDRDFLAANQVFTGVLKEMRQQGLDTTKHKSVIQKEDVDKMYSSSILGTNNPTSLQRQVFFDLSIHFAHCGREGL